MEVSVIIHDHESYLTCPDIDTYFPKHDRAGSDPELHSVLLAIQVSVMAEKCEKPVGSD